MWNPMYDIIIFKIEAYVKHILISADEADINKKLDFEETIDHVIEDNKTKGNT